MQAFAIAHVAPVKDMGEKDAFPREIWSAMGDEGLLGLALPKVYGGGGADIHTLLSCGEGLVRFGGCYGLGMSWSAHGAMARFLLLAHGNEAQKEKWLPQMASGKAVCSFCVSEPKAGAHPKFLQASAEKKGEGYILNGQKAWATNGPLASVFIVVAITAHEKGRKRFSAFLVPRDAPGLKIIPSPPLDVFKPSPHCSLSLENCEVPADAMLGPEGEIFEKMAKGFRETEDLLGAGLALGAMGWQLDRLAEIIARRNSTGEQREEEMETLGKLEALLTVHSTLAHKAADLWEAEGESTNFLRTTMGMRENGKNFHSTAEWVTSRVEAEPFFTGHAMHRDMERAVNMQRRVDGMKKQRLGELAIKERTEKV